MRWFSFGPSLAMRGRKFKGLRGWSGKPTHPPLTDVPITAYIFAAGFDFFSGVLSGQPLRHELYNAATWTLLGGAGVSLLTAFTGFWDWLKSTPKGTQAWRTANAHMATMITVTLIVVADILLRELKYGNGAAFSPNLIIALSVASALLVSIGATIGGGLVYDYGFNVETSGDHPVWARTERDFYPGQYKRVDIDGRITYETHPATGEEPEDLTHA